jgi:lipopolysaccharide export system protein LptA
MKNKLSTIILTILSMFIISIPALGADPGITAKKKPRQPIHIEADKMVSRQQENAVVFSGNVRATQGELILNADTMTVYHNKEKQETNENKGGQGKIKKMIATGNVKLTNNGWVATGDRVEFYSQTRKVILKGNTKVWQGNNIITGETIELDLDADTTIIEPDTEKGGRVKAFFYPDSEQ